MSAADAVLAFLAVVGMVVGALLLLLSLLLVFIPADDEDSAQ